MARNRFFSVTQLNKYIKGILETDIILSHVWLKGEISNLKRNSSGHTFFSLKDRTSAISCVLFKTAGEIMDIKLVNGAEVFLYGYVSLYERTDAPPCADADGRDGLDGIPDGQTASDQNQR